MTLADLLTVLERRVTDTPDTPRNPGRVSAKPVSLVACTLDTPDTPQISNTCTDVQQTGLATQENANTSEVKAAVHEGTSERAAILEIDGGLSRTRAEKVAALFEAFYAHLMGIGKETNCCYAPNDRYCAEGKRLRDAYYGAVS